MYYELPQNLTYNDTILYINNTIIIPLEQQISSYKTMTWIFITACTLSLILWYMISKQIRKHKENRKTIELKTKEIETIINKLKEGQKINQIDIRDLPKPIKENILQTKGFWGKIFEKLFFESDKQGHKPPFMLLIHSDMTAEIKHNAKEGEIILQAKDKNKTKKRILLTRGKLIDLKLPNNQWTKMWIHFEDEAEGYPLEPMHHSKSFYQIVEAIQMNKNLLGGTKGKFPKIIFIIAGIILIGGGAIWYFSSKGDATTTIQVANTTTETINNTIQNATYSVIKI